MTDFRFRRSPKWFPSFWDDGDGGDGSSGDGSSGDGGVGSGDASTGTTGFGIGLGMGSTAAGIAAANAAAADAANGLGPSGDTGANSFGMMGSTDANNAGLGNSLGGMAVAGVNAGFGSNAGAYGYGGAGAVSGGEVGANAGNGLGAYGYGGAGVGSGGGGGGNPGGFGSQGAADAQAQALANQILAFQAQSALANLSPDQLAALQAQLAGISVTGQKATLRAGTAANGIGPATTGDPGSMFGLAQANNTLGQEIAYGLDSPTALSPAQVAALNSQLAQLGVPSPTLTQMVNMASLMFGNPGANSLGPYGIGFPAMTTSPGDTANFGTANPAAVLANTQTPTVNPSNNQGLNVGPGYPSGMQGMTALAPAANSYGQAFGQAVADSEAASAAASTGTSSGGAAGTPGNVYQGVHPGWG